jgi:hypothetical protein
MLSEPLGRDWMRPYRLFDLLVAIEVARQNEHKIWAKLRGDDNHVYEVWPGGRNVAWPVDMLEKRRQRQAPLHADHKCKHVWEARPDGFKQCFQCGQVRADSHTHRRPINAPEKPRSPAHRKAPPK